MDEEKAKFYKIVEEVKDLSYIKNQRDNYHAEAIYLGMILDQKFDVKKAIIDTQHITFSSTSDALQLQIKYLDTSRALVLSRLSKKLDTLSELEHRLIVKTLNPPKKTDYPFFLLLLWLSFAGFCLLCLLWFFVHQKKLDLYNDLLNRKTLAEARKIEKEGR